MKSALRDVLASRGYVFLKSYMPGSESLTVARTLGALAETGSPNIVHQLKPTTNSTPNTYSGQYGLREFPLHTDFAHWQIPPRYIMLRCVVGLPRVYTRIVDGAQLFGSDDLELMSRSLAIPRRPVRGKIYLLRLFKPLEGLFGLLRWDSTFIRPASAIGVVAFERLTNIMICAKTDSVHLVQYADTLIIDNWRVLHGRTAVPNDTGNRIVDRVYLEQIH